MPLAGEMTSHGSVVVAVHPADGFSAFVIRTGSGAVTCGAPALLLCTANTSPFGGVSVVTGGPA